MIDLSPRWWVKDPRKDMVFVLPFNQFDEMLVANCRASALGFKITTLRARGGHNESLHSRRSDFR